MPLPDPPRTRPWWDTKAVLLAMMALSTAPLWFVRIPPLIDLPGHMGRYYVQLNLADSPVLQRNWDFHWRLIGNLGVDLLMAPLGHALGVERAVWWIALLIPPLMIWAIARVSRALHGQVSPFALAAAPFAFAFPYQYGFLNYWLGCALALHALASWAHQTEGTRSGLRRDALFALAACLIWLTHIYGWAILVVLVAAFELSRAWRRDPRAWPSMVMTILRRMWPVLVPAALMVVWRRSGGGETGEFFNFTRKLVALVHILRDQNLPLDILSLILALTLIYVGLRSPAAKRSPGLLVGAGMLLALVVVMPRWLFGSCDADIRLWPIVFIVALAAIAPADRAWRGGAVVAGAAILVFATRMVFAAQGFAAYDESYARHLQALDHAPRGASIAVLINDEFCAGWRYERLSHLDSLAIVRKEAFVNSQWTIAGDELLTPLHARGTAFNSDPSEVVDAPDCDRTLGPALERKIAQVPRDRFRYLWLLGFDAHLLGARPGLQRLYSDEASAFYALQP